MKNVAIVGAGISGLSCAYALTKHPHNITIFAKAFPPNTTSNRAAAFWFPYHIRNDKRGIKWCQKSYDVYRQLSNNNETGISMHQLIKVLRENVEDEEPVWIEFMPEGSYRLMQKDELKNIYQSGYDITVPLIETQIFLPYLYRQLEENLVRFEQKEIEDLNDLAKEFDVVINCSALGSRKLCNDLSVIPVRGQVALLEPKNDLPIFLDNEKPLYVVPRQDSIIVGGTYEQNVFAETTEPSTIERILTNAYEVFPELEKQKVLGSWAGLRPYRPELRVEREGNIIHNYGHGGSGFTLAFGCAEEVENLVNEI